MFKSIKYNLFTLFVCDIFISIIIYLCLILLSCINIFIFIATHQVKRCERPRFYSRMFIVPYLNEFNHSARINYRCLGNPSYMQAVCVNGKWEPEPDCTGKICLKHLAGLGIWLK
jgi:hypothetical protein